MMSHCISSSSIFIAHYQMLYKRAKNYQQRKSSQNKIFLSQLTIEFLPIWCRREESSKITLHIALSRLVIKEVIIMSHRGEGGSIISVTISHLWNATEISYSIDMKTRVKNEVESCPWWTGKLLDKSLIWSLALMITYGSLVFLAWTLQPNQHEPCKY